VLTRHWRRHRAGDRRGGREGGRGRFDGRGRSGVRREDRTVRELRASRRHEAAEWTNTVKAAIQTFGGLNVLVNNAGISTYGLIEHYSRSDWETTIGINLTGVFNGIKAVIPALSRAGGGSIVNISSAAAMLGYPSLPAYVASKWGVRGAH
jgi:NAD(P)-dependent dehydrogenase (short-subunit alcohol dehydrogenase family)